MGASNLGQSVLDDMEHEPGLSASAPEQFRVGQPRCLGIESEQRCLAGGPAGACMQAVGKVCIPHPVRVQRTLDGGLCLNLQFPNFEQRQILDSLF